MNHFPTDFLWGTAASAFQVESYNTEDGAGVSNWLDFCRQKGKIANGDSPDVSPGQYHNYTADVATMREIGIRAYRTSLSWSRIFPDGDGKPNPKGFDFYDRLIDELLQNNITPWLTFFHWDLPLSLEKRFGGWQSKETVKCFADYVSFVTAKLSDRVTNFFSVNEIDCFTRIGYGDGVYAPGLHLTGKALNQVIYHGCLAHGVAVQAAREAAKQPIRIGIADNPVVTMPVFATPENIDAARQAFRLENAAILSLIREGRYPTEYLEKLGDEMPDFTDEDLKIIASPMDFQGLNIYSAQQVIADPATPSGYRIIPKAMGYPKMNSPWLFFDPEAIYWGCRLLCELWPTSSVYISENGCSAIDQVVDDGQIYDTHRINFLRESLKSAQRLTAENYPLKGYFEWTLLDNFEWSYGFDARFGIVHIDHQTNKRTPKLSAQYYGQVIEANEVL